MAAQAEKLRRENSKTMSRKKLLETLRAAIAMVPESCAKSAPSRLLVVVLPDRSRLKRNWPCDTPLSALFACIDIHLLEHDAATAKAPSYRLLSKLDGICLQRPDTSELELMERSV